MKPKHNHSGVKDYGTDTLALLRNDLQKNPDCKRRGSWEFERLIAVKAELDRRMK